MTGIERALLAAGSARALAQACGVGETAVSKWKARGYVPISHTGTIAKATGVAVRDLIDPAVVRAVSEETR